MTGRNIMIGAVLVLALQAGLPGTAPARSDGARDEAALIADLGLEPADLPVSERPGWRRPAMIVVRADSAERLAWLQAAVPDVELVNASEGQRIAQSIDEIQALIGGCDADLIQRARNLHWVQVYSAGVESCLDIPAFTGRGLLLTNMQRVASPEIADHVMGMLLVMARGIVPHIRAQTSGQWRPDRVPFDERQGLGGKTMLIVGLGGIGTQVGKRAHAFGMNVVAIRNSGRPGPEFVSYVGRPDELLSLTRRADVVVNSTPLTPETEGMFDAAFFASMKPTAYFINVGRGASVDTDALVAALEDDRIAGAGLDVTDPEPLPPGHRLWQFDNVVITPHVSAGSDQLRDRLFRVVRENLRRYVAGEPMLSVVDIEKGY